MAAKTDSDKSGTKPLVSPQKKKTGVSPNRTSGWPSPRSTAAAALCDKNYESNEKPKTSEKCYYNASPSSTSDNYCESVGRLPGPLPSSTGRINSGESASNNRTKVTAVATIMTGNSTYKTPPPTSSSSSSSRHRHASLSDSASDDSDLDLQCVRNSDVRRRRRDGLLATGLDSKEDPEKAFDRLVHSSGKGIITAARSATQQAEHAITPVSGTLALSSLHRDNDDADGDIPTSLFPIDDQIAKPQLPDPQRSPVKYEGSTSIWGKQIASFDLSDDYVNDYLREQQAKKIENVTDEPSSTSPLTDLLLEATAAAPASITPTLLSPSSSPQQRQAQKVSSRAASFDIIPACVPDSIGTEIDDIIQSGFTTTMGSSSNNSHDSEASQDAVSLSSMTSSMSGSGHVLSTVSGGRRTGRRGQRRSGRSAEGGSNNGGGSARSSGKKAGLVLT
jgi:hypothetical protein